MMTINKKLELVRTIQTLAMKINLNSDIDIFTEFLGHVNGFHFRLYINGWKSGIKPDYNKTAYIDMEKSEYTLKAILEHLKDIEKECCFSNKKII